MRWLITESDCQACQQADTYENIMDNFCRADFGKSLTITFPQGIESGSATSIDQQVAETQFLNLINELKSIKIN